MEGNSPEREEFDKWVHDALNHLYDSGVLDALPLLDALVSPEGRAGSRSQDLRRVLIAAIQAMKPARNTPLQSRDWRGYQILEQRFLTGLTPAEVIRRMNISRSLFFTEQAHVLKRLADYLWEGRIAPVSDSRPPVSAARPPVSDSHPPVSAWGPQNPPAPTPPEAGGEAADLLEGAALGPVPLEPLLHSLQPILDSLARGRGVTITMDFPPTGETIERGERVLLRQVIISLVAELSYLAPGGRIQVGPLQVPGRFGVRLLAQAGAEEPRLTRMEERQGLSPETSRALLAAMGGSLDVREASGSLEATLSWPTTRQSLPLLVVDDHADVADLFRRYLHGSLWEVTHAESAAQAREVLGRLRPAVILLDVILPYEDGWELLVELKGDPHLRPIPVIVCSAVNEPELVRSLGADGYLPKPVVQFELVRALRSYEQGRSG